MEVVEVEENTVEQIFSIIEKIGKLTGSRLVSASSFIHDVLSPDFAEVTINQDNH